MAPDVELLRAIAVLAETPTRETARLAGLLDLGAVPDASAFTELFVLQLHPYASVYVGAEGAMGGEAQDRVAGFWRALRLDPPGEPDHLATLLGFYAALRDREQLADADRPRIAWRRAREALLWEHLWCWLPAFLRKVDQIAAGPYVAWSRLLGAALQSEAEALPPPPVLPLHLRLAPPLPDAEAGAQAWLQALLTPVRSGLILTHADLARAAGDLGLGLRAGERRAALAALLQQEPAGTTTWLAAEAQAAAEAHDGDVGQLGPIAIFWASRARHTAAALGEAGARGLRACE